MRVSKRFTKPFFKVFPVGDDILTIPDFSEHAITPAHCIRFAEREGEANLGVSTRIELGLCHEDVDARIKKGFSVFWGIHRRDLGH
jgi:hypothetical protein